MVSHSKPMTKKQKDAMEKVKKTKGQVEKVKKDCLKKPASALKRTLSSADLASVNTDTLDDKINRLRQSNPENAMALSKSILTPLDRSKMWAKV